MSNTTHVIHRVDVGGVGLCRSPGDVRVRIAVNARNVRAQVSHTVVTTMKKCYNVCVCVCVYTLRSRGGREEAKKRNTRKRKTNGYVVQRETFTGNGKKSKNDATSGKVRGKRRAGARVCVRLCSAAAGCER